MGIVTADFETFYTKDYSLRRRSEVEYILAPEFQTILCALKVGERPVFVCTGERETRKALASIDWDNAALLSHNTRFDGAILAWRYGIVPRLYLDTLSMARALTHAYTGSSSLAKVAEHLGLVAKGDAVVRAMGMRLEAFGAAQLDEYREYCAHDTELCRTIFDRFINVNRFPRSELKLIDLSLRMFIAPQARLDAAKLSAHLDRVRTERAEARARIEYMDRGVFSSNERFAKLLQAHGVDVPVKVSQTTGEVTYALAKNDRAFKELCADEDLSPEVQVFLQVRLGEKSTIEETRSATLLKLALASGGACTVPYRYYGAHTGRFSGDGGFNFANLKRGSPIRDAIAAPAGHRIVHRDASQIEARMLAHLASCHTLLTAFREGRDVYSEFASRFYRRQITRADTRERFVGKTSVLGLGYGCGPDKFRHVLFIGSGGVSVEFDPADAVALVQLYRSDYAEVPALWWRAQHVLESMLTPPEREIAPEPLPVVRVDGDAITLPNGLAIRYPNLRRSYDPRTNAKTIIYDGAYGVRRIYGPKLIENVTQALARIVVTDIMLRVSCATGRHPIMSTYDSLDYCVPEGDVIAFDALLEAEFKVAPPWAATLPLASEGGWGASLLEAERGVNR